ncbi:MAG: ArsR/SmtB family transcription factor [Vulcanisaeta sp.]|uniref:ArsR/SmtB family transcription factor n=1 Tax=Vulcanisaeta sp. TaxID=2020871 RepID=UPI003D0B35F3
MVEYERDLKKILIWLLGGTRGGTMRLKILMLLRRRPMNPNQLARALNVNYRTIMHHLEVPERNGLVVKMNSNYGAPYFISDKLDKNWNVIEDVMRILGIEGEE